MKGRVGRDRSGAEEKEEILREGGRRGQKVGWEGMGKGRREEVKYLFQLFLFQRRHPSILL
jgi:hypothetical protein